MARTPLFHTLSRVLHTARRAARAGVPVLELAEQERELRAVSRRRFLEVSAAAAAIPLIEACGGDLPTGPPGGAPNVVIVGAGMAGLHCAYRLLKKGVVATVFDAGTRAGGRMLTDRTTFPERMHGELGGELIDTDHQTMRDLSVELGIELLDYSAEDPALATIVAYIGGKALTMQEILLGFSPIAAKIDEALATLTDQSDLFVYYDKPNGGEALDAMSVSTWLDSIGASGPVRTLLEVAFTTEFGLDVDVSNALNMLFLISTEAMKFDVYGASDERFHAKDGNDAFTALLAQALSPGQVELSANMTAIREDLPGRFTLTFLRDTSTFDVTADHVVLAIPFSVLRRLDLKADFSVPKVTAITQIGYGTSCKLLCGFSSRIWREQLGSNGETFSDLEYQSTWETSRLQPGKSGILTNFTGGKIGVAAGVGSPGAQMGKVLPQLEQVFPGVTATSNDKAARFNWVKHPFSRGSYAAYKVGQYTKFAGAEIERYKNVHFCGEHTSLDAQGYMEGAALTGAMAAAEILADLGVPTSKPASRRIESRAAAAGDRILARAEAARTLRRWHAGIPRRKIPGQPA